jgi:hypothetical protein
MKNDTGTGTPKRKGTWDAERTGWKDPMPATWDAPISDWGPIPEWDATTPEWEVPEWDSTIPEWDPLEGNDWGDEEA